MAGENAQLRRDIRDLNDQMTRLTSGHNRHHQVLCKIGDHVADVLMLEPADFDIVRRPAAYVDDGNPSIDPEAIADGASEDLSSTDEHAPVRIEPEVLLPFSAVVTDVSQHDDPLNGPADDGTNDEIDPLTQALQISRNS